MTYNELRNAIKGYSLDDLCYGYVGDIYNVKINGQQFLDLMNIIGETYEGDGQSVLPGGMLDDIDDGMFDEGRPLGWWFMWATTDRF